MVETNLKNRLKNNLANFTDYHFAFALLVAGEPAKAIQTLEAHMRLDPGPVPALVGNR